MPDWFYESLEYLKKAWGVFIMIAWGLWEYRRRKIKGTVDTLTYLQQSVEELSRKYDELLDAKRVMHEELVDLRVQLAEKDKIIDSLRERIAELEEKQKS